jgi:hypothetical protein
MIYGRWGWFGIQQEKKEGRVVREGIRSFSGGKFEKILLQ